MNNTGYVDKKYFPDYNKVPDLVVEFVSNINKKLNQNLDDDDVLNLASDAHYNLVNIHPFADGNGRLSRLIMNYILMCFNQPFVKIFTEDRIEYIDALNATEEKEDLGVFRTFIASQQIKFFKNEIEKFQNSKKGFNLMF